MENKFSKTIKFFKKFNLINFFIGIFTFIFFIVLNLIKYNLNNKNKLIENNKEDKLSFELPIQEVELPKIKEEPIVDLTKIEKKSIVKYTNPVKNEKINKDDNLKKLKIVEEKIFDLDENVIESKSEDIENKTFEEESQEEESYEIMESIIEFNEINKNSDNDMDFFDSSERSFNINENQLNEKLKNMEWEGFSKKFACFYSPIYTFNLTEDGRLIFTNINSENIYFSNIFYENSCIVYKILSELNKEYSSLFEKYIIVSKIKKNIQQFYGIKFEEGFHEIDLYNFIMNLCFPYFTHKKWNSSFIKSIEYSSIDGLSLYKFDFDPYIYEPNIIFDDLENVTV